MDTYPAPCLRASIVMPALDLARHACLMCPSRQMEYAWHLLRTLQRTHAFSRALSALCNRVLRSRESHIYWVTRHSPGIPPPPIPRQLCRHRGIGRAIVEKLVARRGDAALYLLTSKEACPFYEACGFEAMPPWSLPRCIPSCAKCLNVGS